MGPETCTISMATGTYRSYLDGFLLLMGREVFVCSYTWRLICPAVIVRLYSVSFKFFQWTYFNKVSESSQEGIQVPMSEKDATNIFVKQDKNSVMPRELAKRDFWVCLWGCFHQFKWAFELTDSVKKTTFTHAGGSIQSPEGPKRTKRWRKKKSAVCWRCELRRTCIFSCPWTPGSRFWVLRLRLRLTASAALVPSSHSQITGLLSLHILWANSCNKSPLISIDLSIYLSTYVHPFDSISLENPNTSSFYPYTWQNERSLKQWYSLQYQLTPLWLCLFILLLFLLSLYNTT